MKGLRVGSILFKPRLACFKGNVLHSKLSVVQTPCGVDKPSGSWGQLTSACLWSRHFHTTSSSLLPNTASASSAAISTPRSSTSTTPSSPTGSPSVFTAKNVTHSVTLDEQSLDKLYEEMDRELAEVTHYMQSNGRARQYKNLGLTLVTLVAGVIAGAYAAHLGAWFLEKVGLFIFQEEEDD